MLCAPCSRMEITRDSLARVPWADCPALLRHRGSERSTRTGCLFRLVGLHAMRRVHGRMPVRHQACRTIPEDARRCARARACAFRRRGERFRIVSVANSDLFRDVAKWSGLINAERRACVSSAYVNTVTGCLAVLHIAIDVIVLTAIACTPKGFGEGIVVRVEVLREFIEFAKYQNISAAAKKLFITQPALSNHIASIEKELGLELVRHGKTMELTAAGRAFFEGAARSWGHTTL